MSSWSVLGATLPSAVVPVARPHIAVEPDSYLHDDAVAAVRDGGGEVVDVADAEALVWVGPHQPERLPDALARGPGLRWVHLPFAGIEPYVGHLDHERTWTCAKEVYAEPVAEHALALALAGLRGLVGYARARTWSEPVGVNLLGAQVLILGGGGITRSLLRLLGPFCADATVVRRSGAPLDGATVIGPEGLHAALPGADLVVLALPLTPETTGIIGAPELELMAPHAWLVNVARGGHVDTEALVAALRAGAIGGAALDVTAPEPLPDGHPLWSEPRCIVTPHIGNTPEMGAPLLLAQVTENVGRFAAGRELLGLVDVDAGY